MTLPNRNCFFKAGIIISLVALIGSAVVSGFLLPSYPGEIFPDKPDDVRRSQGILHAVIGHFLSPAPYVPIATIISAVAYSLIIMSLIYYFFEKTQAPEILFVAFFTFSFAFESARLIMPLRFEWELPGVYVTAACRVLIFGRYFGLFSLFVAGVCASGLEIREPGNVILLLVGAALIVALGMPIDGFSWDSTLCLISGYASMFKLVEIGIILITTASFFVSAYIRGAREYILIGVGALLVSLGRSLLLTADTWATPFAGLAILVAGTWFICNQLHRVYLWL
ncbi:MAG: hypothetical protein LBE17_12720 [Treponema sp.]|jgi:hypothetical protein|nr:hypothetical protein [Treponema sp.]